MPADPHPLSRFTILEINGASAPISTRLATAMAGKIAADLGAGVIRVEPPEGDPVRRLPPFLGHGHEPGRSALFQFLAASKRSVVIDRTHPEGTSTLARLSRKADAILTDDPGVAAAGLAPVAVLVRPCADGAGLEQPIEEIEILAVGGLLDIIGDPAREPLKLAGHQCAYTAGLAAFTGLVAALKSLARDGTGDLVTVNILDVAYWTNWKSFAERLYTGKSPTRRGEMTEWQVVACQDGHAAIVYLDKDWPALCRMTGAPELDTPALATREGRSKHGGPILERLRAAFATRTRADIQAAAKAAGLPIAPVVRLGELAADPQMIAQGFLVTVERPVVGRLTTPTLPVAWNGRRFAPRAPEDHAHG